MVATGKQYRSAARHFGLPVDTVRSWRADVDRARADAGEPARAKSSGPAPKRPKRKAAPDEQLEEAKRAAVAAFEEPAALSLMGPVDYWRSRLVAAATVAELAVRLEYTGSARDWERLAQSSRGELDKALVANQTAEADRKRREMRDPVGLSRALLSRLPRVLAVAADVELAASIAEQITEWIARRQ